ncbi:bleomycin resistance protein [Noviherbaspirillum aerium]|uniref:bleomycin resistance protein n=1 Tax=Noviherbaspirillum aerium TaxID=2588497 RepID=UPI00124D6051|nr:VOC family protein [Noviherbaspirillum aerium]
MTQLIQSTIPVLASLDLDATIAFYAERLGFATAARHDDYAIVRRDGCEIHFWACKERRIAEHTSCYVRVADAQKLYEEFSRNGVQMPPPVAQPWGMKECHVIDLHGNLLKFGEDISQPSSMTVLE